MSYTITPRPKMVKKKLSSWVKIRFDLKQIGTKAFSTIFVYFRCNEKFNKTRGKLNYAKSFFLHGIQDSDYNPSFTLSQRKLSFVFSIVPFGFESRFPWSDNWFNQLLYRTSNLSKNLSNIYPSYFLWSLKVGVLINSGF